MENEIFKKLKSKLKLDTGRDLEVVGMKGNSANYFLNIYAEQQDDYITIIEECVYHYGKHTETIELTEDQNNELNELLQSTIKDVQQLNKWEDEIQL